VQVNNAVLPYGGIIDLHFAIPRITRHGFSDSDEMTYGIESVMLLKPYYIGTELRNPNLFSNDRLDSLGRSLYSDDM